jgi:hypothetical protein
MLRQWNIKVAAYFARQHIGNFRMARNGGSTIVRWVHVYRVPTTFAQQYTAMLLEVLIERYQETVAVLGRRLAERYGFEYPADLENTVRRDWKAFRAMA